jgi:CRISPR-associated protein Csh2
MSYTNRIFGAAIIRAINANYNADFSGQPRTLPDGVVYATDKVLKYAVKNFIKDFYPNEYVFYFKRINGKKKEDAIPFSLIEAFCAKNPSLAEVVIPLKRAEKEKENDNTSEKEGTKMMVKLKANKKEVVNALLECIDIRLFGATFAMKGSEKKDGVTISIHGPVQITHGVNIWNENNFYSEQIMSPFRNPNENNEDNAATTLGRQTRLHEGHYLHHFSVNPKNLEDVISLGGNGAKNITNEDVVKLKDSLRKGVTYYDSAAKIGCENELLVWVTLNENSNLVLPNFSQLIRLEKEKTTEGKVVFNFSELKAVLDTNKKEIQVIEIYMNKAAAKIKEDTLLGDVPVYDI